MATTTSSSPGRWAVSSPCSKFLTCLGASSPILLSPLLFQGNKGSRSGFCISTVSILLLTETLPAPIVALLPLFVFTDLGLAEDAGLYTSSLSGAFLVVLVDVMMVFLLCLTSVYQRASLLLQDAFGAHMRDVALVCMSIAWLAPLLLHDSIAALLVIVRRLVTVYMTDGIQEHESQRMPLAHSTHSRSGLSGASGTATFCGMGATDSPTPAMSPAALASPVVPLCRVIMGGKGRDITAAQRNITELRLSLQDTNDATRPIWAANGKAPTSAVSRVLSTPLSSSASFRDHPSAASQLATTPPMASESPARGASANSTQPLRCTSRRSPLESEPLSDEQGQQRSRPRPHRPSRAIGGHKIGANKTGKRTPIIEGGKVALPGASSPPPKTIVSNLDDLSSFLYGTRRPAREHVGVKYQKQQTVHRQLAVTTVLTCTLSSALSLSRNHANIYFVEYFGDGSTFGAEVTARSVWTSLLLPTECVALMVAWLHVRVCILRQLHPSAVLCLVIAHSLPFTKWLHGVFIDFDGTVRGLPWGAIITVAGSDAIIKAVATPCNGLCFALPVTVAASTSLVLPTSGISLAVLTNLTDTGPVQMLLLGLVVKFVALVMILLTVELNVGFHRLPRRIFTERRDQSVTTALYESPDERVRRLYCTTFLSRC